MNHKKRCEELRKIRVKLADQMGLGDKIKRTPCDFNGECKGTCPACKAEEIMLSKALLKKAGTATAVAGMTLGLTACGIFGEKDPVAISGEVQIVDEHTDKDTFNRPNIKENHPIEIEDDEEELVLAGDVQLVDGSEID